MQGLARLFPFPPKRLTLCQSVRRTRRILSQLCRLGLHTAAPSLQPRKCAAVRKSRGTQRREEEPRVGETRVERGHCRSRMKLSRLMMRMK
eukprot:6200939-Pleurochrysis_carterae.AAC.6